MRSLILTACAALLSACSAFPAGETLSQRTFAALDAYAAVKAEAASFVTSGPLCSERAVVGCVPDEVVIAIDDVTDRVDPQVEVAIALLSNNALSGDGQRATIRLARQAVRELSATLQEETDP